MKYVRSEYDPGSNPLDHTPQRDISTQERRYSGQLSLSYRRNAARPPLIVSRSRKSVLMDCFSHSPMPGQDIQPAQFPPHPLFLPVSHTNPQATRSSANELLFSTSPIVQNHSRQFQFHAG